jgi:hypothetical protein
MEIGTVDPVSDVVRLPVVRRARRSAAIMHSMLFSNGDFLAGLGLGALGGGAVSAAIAYWAMVSSTKLRALQAFYDGKQAVLSELRMERIVDHREEGIVRKKYYLVIQERLLNNGLPMSPFWEHKFLISDKLNRDDLLALTNTLATVADKILGLADLRTMASELLKGRAGGALSTKKSKQ